MSKILKDGKREASRKAVVEYLVRYQRYIEMKCPVHGTFLKPPTTAIEDRVCPLCITTGRIE